MDPVTAFANVAVALLAFMTEVVKGQPEDVRAKIWGWYVADIDRWRSFFGLDK